MVGGGSGRKTGVFTRVLCVQSADAEIRQYFRTSYPSPTCVLTSFLSPFLKSVSDPAPCIFPSSRTDLDSLETIFYHERKEKRTSVKNWCSRDRDKPSTPEFVSQLVSSNAFLTLREIWQNFVFWVLDSCYGSSVMHPIIIVRMLCVCYSGF